jgi:paraquat-inducible protein B
MSDQIPELEIEPARRAFWQRASFVWVIPVVALVIAIGVAWRSYSERGPLIEIVFADASGLAARETELRYRDIAVGVVEELNFTPDLSGVVASVRLEKEIAPYVDVGATFWIVRPELTTQGVTGLDTVLTGVYVEGAWDNEISDAQDRFQGLNESPLFRPGQEGLQITLRTVAGGNLTANAPITYRGIRVGQVGRAQISREGNFAIAEAIIYDEHTRLVTPNTRFWDTSGFTFSVGPQGAEIDFSSLATLVSGGVTFDTFVSGGGRAQDGQVFEVYPDAGSARDSLFREPEVDVLELRVIFDQNISGLAVDAPVELGGLRIGSVQSVSGIIDRDAFGDSRVRLNVLIAIQPARLGLQDNVSPEAALAFLEDRVRQAGLRARLATAGLLAGGLKIELVEVDDAPEEILLTGEAVIPIMPTTESDISDVAATVEGVVTRINNLPIEELLNGAIDFLASAEALISDPDLRETPADARALLADIRAVTSSEGVQRVPETLDTLLTQLETVLAQIETAELVSRFADAADAATGAANGVTTSLEGLPDLIAQIDALAANAAELPLDELTAEVTQLTRSANAILGSEGAQSVPDTLAAVLTRFESLLAELETAQTATRLTEALAAASEAANGVTTSVEGLPALIERLDALAADAAELPLEELTTQVTDLTRSANAILSTEGAQRVPDALAGALTRFETLLAELETAQTATRLTEALAAASAAADEVTTSLGGVPALVERLNTLAATASELPLDELVAQVTDLSRAAEAVIGTDAARQLPADLGAALNEINASLAALREGGAVENVNETLASARRAADAVSGSLEDLPRLIERAEAVLGQASTTIAGYNRGEVLSRDAQTALRDISRAADALASLARMIERNPSSLLRGR